MKTKPASAPRCSRLIYFLCGFATLGAVRPAGAAEPAVKPYNIFMGTDLSIMRGEKALPVVQVSGQQLSVKVGTTLEKVPIGKVGSFRTKPTLKLARVVVQIDNLQTEQVFANEGEIRAEWARRNALGADFQFQAAQQGVTGLTGEGMVSGIMAAGAAMAGRNGVAPPVAPPPPPDLSLAPSAPMNSGAQLGEGSLDEIKRLGGDAYDALRMKFEISSPQRVPDPYIVFIAEVKDPNERNKNKVLRWYYIEALQDLGPKSQRVHAFGGGLPPGFKVLKVAVHVYSREREVATNRSESRLEMNRDEAHEYILANYLAEHRGATLQPSPAMLELPEGFRARITPHELGQKLELTITSGGMVTQAAGVEADTYLAGVVRDFRFNPALENGRPIEGKVSITLRELIQQPTSVQ